MKLEPRALVVLILAASVASALLALAIAAAVAEASSNLQLSEAATSLLSTVLGAAVGVLASYIGKSDRGGDV
jgi:hypothetical protein